MGAVDLEESGRGEGEADSQAEGNRVLDQYQLTAEEKRSLEGKTVQKNISQFDAVIGEVEKQTGRVDKTLAEVVDLLARAADEDCGGIKRMPCKGPGDRSHQAQA